MTIYRLRVTLLDITPPIWRRIEVSSQTSLAQLHLVLATTMGWQGYHLHEFKVGDQRYGVPDPDYDPPGEMLADTKAILSQALPHKNSGLVYTYDFGDNWTHSVILEDTVPADPNARYPRVIDGARSCPPEECGGSYGYTDLINILANPRHKEHRQMREWAGENFDPEAFPAENMNSLLHPTRVPVAKSKRSR